MRSSWFPILVILFASGASAQNSVYSVQTGSKENTLTLTIANESSTNVARNVKVRAVRMPQVVKISSTSRSLPMLPPGKQAEVSFDFAIERSALIGKQDTLEFVVSDGASLLGRRSFVLKYEGPESYALKQNYPNPFNPQTMIQYDLVGDARVSLMVYDVLGREVRSLVGEVQKAGCYDVPFDARSLASGVYVYRLTAEPTAGGKAFTAVKKMMVLR